MRIPRLLCLLLATICLLSACIYVPAEPIGSTPSVTVTEIPTTPVTEPSATTPPSPPPAELWTAAEVQLAALDMLSHPSDGIVDISSSEYSYDDMVEDLNTLSVVYSKRMSYHSIGRSVAGREIYAAVLGNPNARRQVVVSAAIHAREYMTAQLVMKQMEFYLRYYDVGTYLGIPYATLFDSCCFYIVPMTNPDGVMLAQKGLSSLPLSLQQTIRDIYATEKHDYTTLNLYLSHWKANARGVDLNRNYDALWAQYNKQDSPASYQYKGPSPASEPETQAMVGLIESLTDVACVLCIHSQGEVIYWNCGQEDAARSQAFAETVSDRNGYRVIYEQNNDASLSDWCELEKGIPSITVETGNVMCPLPIEQFSTIWLDNYDLFALTGLYFF